MLRNYHTHTTRCNHATGTEREYIENAIKAGIRTLGFSDHAPLVRMPREILLYRMREDELFEYADSVRALAKEYQKDIRILCGFELEYFPQTHAKEMEFLRAVKPDYLLLGLHYLLYGNEVVISSNIRTEKDFKEYFRLLREGMETGDFLYPAHPDLARADFVPQRTVEDEYRKFCAYAKEKNYPLEINLLGLATGRRYPSETFLRIAGEIGNEVVLGIDAHEPQAFWDKETETRARKIAEKYGLRIVENLL